MIKRCLVLLVAFFAAQAAVGQVPIYSHSPVATGGGGSGCVPAGVAGDLLTDDGAGGCGTVTPGANCVAFMTTPNSANLRACVTDETGTGAAYFAGGNAGTPSAIVLSNGTGLPIGGISATGTPSSSTYLRGDGTWNTPSGGGNVSNTGTPTAGQAAEWTSATVIQGVAVTGTGSYVKATSPTLVTPALGTPASGVLTNATGLPISTGVSGLGTGVATAAAVAVGSAGSVLLDGGGAKVSGNFAKFDASGRAVDGGGAVKPVIYSGALALGTTLIASGACATVVTATATGLATTSTITLTWAATPVGVTGYSPSVTTGRLSVDAYPTANTVNISVCNPTAASITPAAMSVNVVAY